MSAHKIQVEVEVEGSDADDAFDILSEILDAEPAVAEWSVIRG